MQFNYSRRIRRPNFWQINPFIDINDPVNLRQGNPQLRPEFINSFEFNYSKDYKNGSFLTSLYFRNNPDDITQYSDTITAAQYEQLQNAGVDPNAILNTFINASTTNRYGAEFVLQHKQGKNAKSAHQRLPEKLPYCSWPGRRVKGHNREFITTETKKEAADLAGGFHAYERRVTLPDQSLVRMRSRTGWE